MPAKKPLHPALQANADRLKRGEPLHKGNKSTAASAPPARPKIRSKQKKG
jgi:hypothetical protein